MKTDNLSKVLFPISTIALLLNAYYFNERYIVYAAVTLILFALFIDFNYYRKKGMKGSSILMVTFFVLIVGAILYDIFTKSI